MREHRWMGLIDATALAMTFYYADANALEEPGE
jgi:hypothetical protein